MSRESDDDDFDEATLVDKGGMLAHALLDGLDDEAERPETRDAAPKPGLDRRPGLPGLGPAPASPMLAPGSPMLAPASQVLSPPGPYQTPPPDHYQTPPPAGYQTPPPPGYQTPPPPGYQTPLPADYQTPLPPGYQTPLPPGYQTPLPADYQTPLPPGYQTPPQYLSPSPHQTSSGHYPAATGPAKSKTMLVVVAATILVLAGVGLGSILFGGGHESASTSGTAATGAPASGTAVMGVPNIGAEAIDAGLATQIPVDAAPPLAAIEDAAPTVATTSDTDAAQRRPPATRTLQIKSKSDGKVTRVFLRNSKEVRRGAKLFTISQPSRSSESERQELAKKVRDLEKMVKEDPELYGPFLAKAKRTQAKATSSQTTTIKATHAGHARPMVEEGDKVRAGQVLATIKISK